jgi:hypothetical protein
MYLHPVATSVAIIVGVIFIGAFLAYFRDRKKYEGHQEYAADARGLVNRLNGELFRDGEDLVINGTHAGLPVVIRLSYAENTPGLHIKMVAPANFRMFVMPKGTRSMEGRVQVRTNDDSFEARFVTRTDNPTQAKMYLGSKGVLPELGKLGCSSKGFVSFSTGSIEQSEALVPTPNTGKHIQEHLLSLERLAKELAKMPFADRVELKPLKRERRLVLKTVIVAGIIAALVGIITAAQQPRELPLPQAGNQAHLSEGVMPNDALLMGSLADWRAATPADLDPDAAAWARGAGQKDSGRLTLTLDRDGRATKDVVYLLVNEKDGQRRIILLGDGRTRYDVKYSYIGLLAVIPKANISKIQWSSRQPEDPDGDAILLIRKPQDRSSGLIMYFSDGKLVSGVPSDYQSINLLE